MKAMNNNKSKKVITSKFNEENDPKIENKINDIESRQFIESNLQN